MLLAFINNLVFFTKSTNFDLKYINNILNVETKSVPKLIYIKKPIISKNRLKSTISMKGIEPLAFRIGI